MESLRLYQPCTKVDEFNHRGRLYKDVEIVWLMDRKEPVAPYNEIIQGYSLLEESSKPYVEARVQELFTEQELQELQKYLLFVHDDRNSLVEEVLLPVSDKYCGLSSIPVGGLSDHYMLSREPEYSLPFEVYGYYNVSNCEEIGSAEPEEDTLPLERVAVRLDELEDLFSSATKVDVVQRALLYTQLGLSSDEVHFLERLEMEQAVTFQQLAKAFIADLISGDGAAERPELAKAWLRAFVSPKASKKGWQYLWKESN